MTTPTPWEQRIQGIQLTSATIHAYVDEMHRYMQEEIAEWRASLDINETDELLENLGLDPEHFRTDGGFINHMKVRAAILHPDEYSVKYCKKCCGIGIIDTVFHDDESGTYSHPDHCHECGGSGEIVTHSQAAYRAGLADAVKWIDVNEKLPDPWSEVIVYPRPTDYCCEARMGRHGCAVFWEYKEHSNWGVERIECNVTHWMPLPAAPKP